MEGWFIRHNAEQSTLVGDERCQTISHLIQKNQKDQIRLKAATSSLLKIIRKVVMGGESMEEARCHERRSHGKKRLK